MSDTELVPLSELVISEPDYGAGERAIAMQSADDVKYIRVTDFDDNGIVPGNKFVTAAKIEEKYRLQEGDVLFARSGATAGKTFIYPKDLGAAIFAGYCIRFRFDKSKALPKFVYFYTKTERYQSWVRSIQRPSGQPNINKEEFKEFSLPLPDTNTQRVLVGDLEAARTQRRDKLAQADALLSGLDAWLLQQLGLQAPIADKRPCFAVKLGNVSKTGGRLDVKAYEMAGSKSNPSQQHKLLGDYVTRFQQPLSKADVQREDYITLSTNGTFKPKRITEWREVSGEGLFKSQMFLAKRGQVVFSKIDLRSGAIAVVDRDRIAVTTEFPVYDVDTTELNADFLVLLLRSSYFQDWMNSLSSGHSGRKRIHSDQFENFLIPLPLTGTQKTIADEVQRRRDEARCLRLEAETVWNEAKAHFEVQLLGESSTRNGGEK